MAKNIMVVGTVAAALAAAPMVAPAPAHADTPAASGDAKPQGDAASPLPPSLADTLAPDAPNAPGTPAKPESAAPDAAAPQDGAAMPSDDAGATAPDTEVGEDAPAAQTPPMQQDEAAAEDAAAAADAAQATAPGFKTVEEYNALLKAFQEAHPGIELKDLVNNDEFMHIVLSRRLVKEAGYDALKAKCDADADFKAMLDWLLGDYEMLSYYVFTGDPEANEGKKGEYYQPTAATWMKSLEVLKSLHKKHVADTVATAKGGNAENPSLNKRLMASVALTHSVPIHTWIQLDWYNAKKYNRMDDSEAVERYEIFKRFYEHGMLYRDFDKLTVPELRMVMWAPVSNDELQWANYYYHVKLWKNTDYATNPKQFGISDVRHMGGMFPYGVYDYAPSSHGGLGDQYYAPSNKEKWNEKYGLAVKDDAGIYDFDLKYGVGADRQLALPIWVVLETRGVCYQISATSTVGLAAMGIPSSYTEQPAHVSFLTYNKDGNGNMTWGQGYDVYGMKRSGKKGTASSALPLGWSDLPWSSYYSMSYVFPAGEALTNYKETDFRTAQGMYFLGEIALEEQKADKAEKLFNEAINAQYMHLGAWDGLVRAYDQAKNKTAQDWIGLATKAQGKIRQYASVYNDYILNAIVPHVTAGSLDHYNLVAMLAEDLRWAKDAKDAEIGMVQPGYCREFGNWWYSNLEFPATFSFNTSGFTLSKTFAESNLAFEYSIDGGSTWKLLDRKAGEATATMPEADKLAVTAESDIRYRAGEGSNAVVIDITAQNPPASNQKNNTVNDDEDVFMNIQQGIEFSVDSGTTWKPLTSEETFEGDKEVWLRWGYSGTKAASQPTKVNFTQGEGTPERSYIKSKGGKITVEQAPPTNKGFSNANLIDGKPDTTWELQYLSQGLTQDESGNKVPNHQHEFVFKFANPTFLSAFEYIPAASMLTGSIQACEVYVSMDGVTWDKAGSAAGWPPTAETKTLNLEVPALAQYVKIKTTKVGTINSMNAERGYLTAAEFRFFENYHVRSLGLERLELDASGLRKDYVVGDLLDMSNAAITAHFEEEGKTARIPATALDWDVRVFDEPGARTVTGTYGGKQVSFEVQVAANERTPNAISTITTDGRTFYAGETVPSDALRVQVTDGTASWYLLPQDYSVAGTLVEGAADYNVTTTTGLMGTVQITAEAGAKSLSVEAPEGFNSNLTLGDSFDPAQATVTLTRANGQSETLDAARYSVQVITEKDGKERAEPLDTLTTTPGSKKIRFTLKDSALHADLSVTVLPYVEEGPFTFEVAEDGSSCSLTAYAPEVGYEAAAVVIPAEVSRGGRSYPVTSIGGTAFANAPKLTGVRIPGSVRTIVSGAFAACDQLTNVFMVDHASLDGFTAQEGSFSAKVKGGLVYLDPSLKVTTSPIPGYLLGDLAATAQKLEIVAPHTTSYTLGEELDLTGLEVYGVLADGTKVPAVAYTVKGYDKNLTGTQTVAVTLTGKDLTATFNVTVTFPEVRIEREPEGGVFSSFADVKPLTVDVSAGHATPEYQWFYKEHENEAGDEIKDATEASYAPTKNGYYWAKVCVRDSKDNTSSPVQTQTVRIDVSEDYVAAANGKGYTSVTDLINTTTGDITIDLLKDSVSRDGVTITGRTVTINGHGHTYKRGDHTVEMFSLPNDKTKTQSLVLNNVLLDGSAIWGGEVDEMLGRGTVAQPNGRTNSKSLIAAQGPTSFVTLAEGTILQNNDGVSAGINGNEGGAAVYLRDSSTLTANNVKIRDCGTDDYGGAIWAKCRYQDTGVISINLQDVEISGCSAGKDGGSLFISEFVKLEASNVAISKSKAGNAAGAIWFGQYAENPYMANVTIKDSAAKIGGGIRAERKVALYGATLEGNRAEGDGGAVYAMPDDQGKGAGALELKDGSKLMNNVAGGSGAAVYTNDLNSSGTTFEGNRAAEDGGAIAASTVSSARDRFDGNEAATGAAIAPRTSLTVGGSTFDENHASKTGDAVHLPASASLTLTSAIGQEIYLEHINDAKVQVLADLKGASMPLVTDEVVTDGLAVLQIMEQTGEVNVTLNGGKLAYDSGKLCLAKDWHDLSTYVDDKGNPVAPQPTEEGKVFAGWYSTDDPAAMDKDTAIDASERAGRVAYPRFVDAQALTVKVQAKAGTTLASNATNLRLLSSTTGDAYQSAGFTFTVNGGPEIRRETQTVLPSLQAAIHGGVDSLTPEALFAADSTRFMAHELNGIPQSAFDTRLKVTPFWVTLDGTEVTGQSREFTVGDVVKTGSEMYDAGISHAQKR